MSTLASIVHITLGANPFAIRAVNTFGMAVGLDLNLQPATKEASLDRVARIEDGVYYASAAIAIAIPATLVALDPLFMYTKDDETTEDPINFMISEVVDAVTTTDPGSSTSAGGRTGGVNQGSTVPQAPRRNPPRAAARASRGRVRTRDGQGNDDGDNGGASERAYTNPKGAGLRKPAVTVDLGPPPPPPPPPPPSSFGDDDMDDVDFRTFFKLSFFIFLALFAYGCFKAFQSTRRYKKMRKFVLRQWKKWDRYTRSALGLPPRRSAVILGLLHLSRSVGAAVDKLATDSLVHVPPGRPSVGLVNRANTVLPWFYSVVVKTVFSIFLAVCIVWYQIVDTFNVVYPIGQTIDTAEADLRQNDHTVTVASSDVENLLSVQPEIPWEFKDLDVLIAENLLKKRETTGIDASMHCPGQVPAAPDVIEHQGGIPVTEMEFRSGSRTRRVRHRPKRRPRMTVETPATSQEEDPRSLSSSMWASESR